MMQFSSSLKLNQIIWTTKHAISSDNLFWLKKSSLKLNIDSELKIKFSEIIKNQKLRSNDLKWSSLQQTKLECTCCFFEAIKIMGNISEQLNIQMTLNHTDT